MDFTLNPKKTFLTKSIHLSIHFQNHLSSSGQRVLRSIPEHPGWKVGTPCIVGSTQYFINVVILLVTLYCDGPILMLNLLKCHGKYNFVGSIIILIYDFFSLKVLFVWVLSVNQLQWLYWVTLATWISWFWLSIRCITFKEPNTITGHIWPVIAKGLTNKN